MVMSFRDTADSMLLVAALYEEKGRNSGGR